MSSVPPASSPDRVHRVLPWVASAAVHVGVVAIGFVVTWTVVRTTPEREPALITASFDALEYQPVVALESVPLPDAVPPAESASAAASAARADVPLPSPSELAASGFGRADLIPSPADALPAAGEERPVTFAGLAASNARRIVYVVDASGSMVRAMSIILDELRRSLDQLGPRQEFAVVFFQRRQALVVPPSGRLVPATRAQRDRVMTWIESNVIPEGRSNPLAALEYALGLRPDVIFLLSENITGSGEFEIDQSALLTALDRLNPRDARTGRRSVRINCVQFLDPDPIDTLRRIADLHGDERGYRFLGRAELGLGG